VGKYAIETICEDFPNWRSKPLSKASQLVFMFAQTSSRSMKKGQLEFVSFSHEGYVFSVPQELPIAQRIFLERARDSSAEHGVFEREELSVKNTLT
jgi:hypothetical protein